MFTSRKIAAVLGTAVLCFGLSGQAQAADGDGTTYSCSYSSFGDAADTTTGVSDQLSYSSASYNNLCGSYTSNQNSAVATATAVIATAASQASTLVSNRISNALSGTGGVHMAANGFSASTGMSGGNMGGKVGAWVSGSYSDVSDDNTDTRFDGTVYTAMVGVDYRVAPKVVIGVAGGYEDVDVDTQYNQSVLNGEDGNVSSDGYTVAPYIGVQLSQNASADLTVGYSDIDYDTLRFDPLTGDRLTGSTEAERYFVNAGVQGNHIFHRAWNLRGRLGVFYVSEDKDAFTEITNNASETGANVAQGSETVELGQVNADARLGYLFDMVEPYALVGLDFDFTKDEAAVGAGQTKASFDSEDFGARFGGGLNLRLGSNVTGGIEAYTVEFRDDYEEVTATAGLRVNF